MLIGLDQRPDLLAAYMQLATGRGAAFPAQALRDRLGDGLDLMLAAGAMQRGRPLSVVSCTACFEGHNSEVEYDSISRRSFFFCVEAGRVDLDGRELETVVPNLLWLPGQLARTLNVRPSPPRCTLIEGAAWWLGDVSVGSSEVSIALVVSISSTAAVQQLIETLQRRPPLDLGLILFAGDPLPAYVGDLTRYQPIPVNGVVSWRGETICILPAKLEAWVRSLLRGIGKPSARRGGRPSNGEQIMTIFGRRRQREEPYTSKLSEARATRAEWYSHFPDTDPPALTTIRNHLPEITPP